jgi:hypothetical protein
MRSTFLLILLLSTAGTRVARKSALAPTHQAACFWVPIVGVNLSAPDVRQAERDFV